jgi:hypothetical protein
MSLINDALKRAKEAQENQPPPSAPQPSFISAGETQPAGRRGPLLPFAFLGLVGLLLVIVLWQWNQLRGAPEQVRAVSAQASPVTLSPEPAPPAPVVPATGVTVQSPPTNAPEPLSAAPAAPAEPASVAPTNAPPPPQPAPLRLQAIIYSPDRPSATISGKSLFIGERIRDFRLARIDQNSVTLVSATETNLLELP